jgi:glycosyltransferase involved in cell wall biosynthesis
MEMYPELSIIIPTYNTGKFLVETMNSIFQQTYNDYEIILIDDRSTDDTPDIIRSFTDRRIKKIFLERNSGGCSTPRNVGIINSKGKYISIFDSDDVMLSDKLELSLKFLKQNDDIGLLFTNYMVIDEKGETIIENKLSQSTKFAELEKIPYGTKMFRIRGKSLHKALYSANWIGPSSCIIPKKVLDDVGNFDSSLNYAEDRDLYFRISNKYDFGYLDIIGHGYRKRKNSQVDQFNKKGHLFSKSLIEAVKKQLKNESNIKAIFEGKKLISKCLYSRGYSYQTIENMRKARKNYLLSLREYPLLASLRGLLITLIPLKIFRKIKAMRKKSSL